MADPSFFVGIVGNIISILVFASPITTFRRIVRNKSTEDFRWLPYVTILLSTSLWTFYGLLKPGGLLVVTVNGAGAALEAAYVTLYLVYAPKETKAKMAKLVLAVNVGFLAAVVVVMLLALHGGARLLAVGLLCAALTIGMYAAPMAVMRTVVKTRSVEYMPFSLSFFLFLNGGVWSAYSLLVKDFFIGLALYAAYRKKAKTVVVLKGSGDEAAAAEEADEEEGLARLVGQVEMAQRRVRLHKGLSLPKPSGPPLMPSPRAGFGLGLGRSIVKSLSATPVELHSVLYHHGLGRFEAVKKDDPEANA